MTLLTRAIAILLAAALLTSCATNIAQDKATGTARLEVQNKLLEPSNGGTMIQANDLLPGDIVLSATNGVTSVGIRALTLSPVSHASLYLGSDSMVEAVGSGIRKRSVEQFLQGEATAVAFRYPGVTSDQALKMAAFADKHVGEKYNFMGIVLQAPFTLERRLCELPLMPALVRDFCVRGVAAVQLGLGSNDRFFCSQFVLEAYRSAGLPLTDADPRMISPDDLLHMREGDVSAVKIRQALQYVGHLKLQPLPPATQQAEN